MPTSLPIALVDDNPLVCASLDSLIRSAGMTTRTFSGGKALLDFAGLAEIACVITDLNMPGMNGLALQTELLARGHHTPIIFMTAFPTQEAQQRALSAGAIAFLTKPISPQILLQTLEQTLDQGLA